MQPRRRFYAAAAEAIGDREAVLVVSTEDLGRDGDIWLSAGAELGNFRKNPIVLFSHDPA
ncbi:MAG: hypothetical protein QOJ54_3602, partial [Aliidongia sp.]|nr:hypothetical protein [Aliidongia sp.]